MKDEHIAREISAFIDAKLGSGEIVHVRPLASEIIREKSGIHGEDCDFYIGCAYGYLTGVIKKAIRRFEPADGPDEQLVLDGFDCLQKGYPMERDGERVLVPTDLCTDDELLGRAFEHRQMARGHNRHAEELEAYVRGRRQAAE